MPDENRTGHHARRIKCVPHLFAAVVSRTIPPVAEGATWFMSRSVGLAQSKKSLELVMEALRQVGTWK